VTGVRLAAALADRYTLGRELGRGRMATVYLAQDLKHDRVVALTVLHPDLAATLGPERFQREVRFAARLQHPHVLTVLDSGEGAGQLWFTMPYDEGESLRARLTRAVGRAEPLPARPGQPRPPLHPAATPSSRVGQAETGEREGRVQVEGVLEVSHRLPVAPGAVLRLTVEVGAQRG
jgi:hypothetical protein